MAYFRKRGCKCQNKKKCKCDAKWSFTLDIGVDPQTGKRLQKTVSGFDRKIDAEEAAAAILLELKNGVYARETDMKFKDYVQEWIDEYERNEKIKSSTIRTRKYSIQKLLPYFAHVKMKDINRKMYQDALNDLKDNGTADNTLDGLHSLGKMIFKKAMQDKLIKYDPTEFARVNKTRKTFEDIEKEKELVKYLEKEELSLFLKTAYDKGIDQDYAMFMLLAYSGMRVGELCVLKWTDINFDERTISITKTYYSENNTVKRYELLPPKTPTSWRKIIVEQVVLDELQKLKPKQNILKMKFRSTYHDKDFIFVKKNVGLAGYPQNEQAVNNRMKRLLKLAGLNESLTPHSFRHTHTSLLAEAGVGLPEIMDRLGHKDDKTTRNVYMHVTDAMVKTASIKFGELMKNI